MFSNREEAGKLLAKKINAVLKEDNLIKDLVVLGIPRGGVVVASEVAKTLKVSLDILIVKKISSPNDLELAVGANGSTTGSLFFDTKLIKELGLSDTYLNQEIKINQLEIKRREKIFRQGKPATNISNKTVIIVDDGAATGATIIAGTREVWNRLPKRVIVGLPVVAQDTLMAIEKEADEVIYLDSPSPFFSVGQFYEEFPQVKDEEVIKILNESL